MQKEVCVLAASGMLGSGFSEDTLHKALSMKPDVIGCDAGSCDPGPYFLGAGVSRASRAAVKRDLRLIVHAGVENGIPVLVGSAGTAGGNPHLEWTLEILDEIVKEDDLHFKLATIESEISKEKLIEYFQAGKVKELYPAPELNEKKIKNFTRIVGVMGPEPYIKALEEGAQVVIAGRSSDTSIYAAVPIMKGLNNGPAWHAAKLLECGTGCVELRARGDCMMAWVREDSFSVEPPNAEMRCTPVSCVSHALYENASPFDMYEPGVVLHMQNSTYTAENDRRVLIKGSILEHSKQYTVKIEGAELLGYREIAIGGVRDPLILRQFDTYMDGLIDAIHKKIKISTGFDKDDYKINYHVYGNPNQDDPKEIGVLFQVLAKTEKDAHSIMANAWHLALHHPIKEWSGLQSQFAFPFSPPAISTGAVYGFCLNHIIEVDDPLELFTINYRQF
ncbi:acyclic terpene utilization AtuA family protein [Aminivibrio sp.]|uniref:acyclic terpene utilization AtuA family protein n=1 Tax=Aminivibrio sp. TaxID=1872489 RepID=UPI00345E7172